MLSGRNSTIPFTVATSVIAAPLALITRITGNPSVCACKCGPDYIDPMFHREVLGVDSKNLDLFFSEEDILKEGYLKHTKDADITITEGVMGFYDGMSLDSVKGSSYDVAQTLGFCPIII